MKRSFLMGLVIVSAFGILGCGGGGSSSSPYTTVDIGLLNDGYTVSYSEGVNIGGEIIFCSNEYNITGSIESNGSFSTPGTQIVFDQDANGSDDFYLKTDGPTPGELKEVEWYEIDGSLKKTIQIINIAEINCTG